MHEFLSLLQRYFDDFSSFSPIFAGNICTMYAQNIDVWQLPLAWGLSSRKRPINNPNITNSCWYYPNYEVYYLNVHRNIVNTVKYVHIFSEFFAIHSFHFAQNSHTPYTHNEFGFALVCAHCECHHCTFYQITSHLEATTWGETSKYTSAKSPCYKCIFGLEYFSFFSRCFFFVPLHFCSVFTLLNIGSTEHTLVKYEKAPEIITKSHWICSYDGEYAQLNFCGPNFI